MSTKFNIGNLCQAGGVILTTCLSSSTIAIAQPIPDETLPNNSKVNLENNTYQIDGGTVAGDNLFHSFSKFSVPTGTEALFNNNLGIQNIISRVTGDSISNIDGVLRAMGNANLFFLNPNGVIFGSNSSLDIGGSFITTTADSLQFEDGMEFSASNPQAAPLLTLSTPVGLQFGNKVGDITSRSGLLFLDSESTFALIGGDINLEGGVIESFPGNIEIGSVAKNSRVSLISVEEGWTLNYESVKNFQDINLTQSRNLMDGESDSGIILSGMEIQIQGRNLTLRDEQQILVDRTLKINTLDTLKIIGSGNDSNFPSSLLSQAFSDTDGGNIIINTGRLVIENGGIISSEVTGDFDLNIGELIPATGNGGDIIINAAESIEVTEENSGIFSSTSGFGSAGNIVINTEDLSLNNGAVVTAESIGVDANGEPLTTGLGGEIKINAFESIRLNEGTIASSSSGEGDNAGSVSLETNRLSVKDGSEISVSAAGSSLAGNLNIDANFINLDRSSLSAKTRVGDRGNIILNNADSLLLNNSQITTNATQSATGGDIAISSLAIALLNDSNITANAFEGQGGNIQITTQGILRESNSEIMATSEFGIDGTVTFNTLDIDPISGFEELPEIPIDTENILAQDFCKLEDEKIAKGSSFTITGRGGLIPTSKDSLSNRDRLVDWVSRDDINVSQSGTVGIRQRQQDSNNRSYPKIQQSQGLLIATDGST